MWITNTMGKNNKKSQKKTTAKNNKNNFYLLYNYIWSNPISQRSWPQCCNNAALWSRDLHSLMYSEIGRIEMLSNTGDWQLLFLIMIQCTWYYNIYNIFSIFGVLSFLFEYLFKEFDFQFWICIELDTAFTIFSYKLLICFTEEPEGIYLKPENKARQSIKSAAGCSHPNSNKMY